MQYLARMGTMNAAGDFFQSDAERRRQVGWITANPWRAV